MKKIIRAIRAQSLDTLPPTAIASPLDLDKRGLTFIRSGFLLAMPGTGSGRDDSASSRQEASKASVEREDDPLLNEIRAGDEASFAKLVARYERSMIRAARAYVRDRATAEEVVQETWLAVLKGLRGFKHRSSFKTWLFRLLANHAKKRLARQSREFAETTITAHDEEAGSKWFDASGEWRREPPAWGLTPEANLLTKEAATRIYEAISSLPVQQRIVITLRDLEGWTAAQACEAMKISPNNQRVLLHLARTKVQQMLDWYFTERRRGSSHPGGEESGQ